MAKHLRTKKRPHPLLTDVAASELVRKVASPPRRVSWGLRGALMYGTDMQFNAACFASLGTLVFVLLAWVAPEEKLNDDVSSALLLLPCLMAVLYYFLLKDFSRRRRYLRLFRDGHAGVAVPVRPGEQDYRFHTQHGEFVELRSGYHRFGKLDNKTELVLYDAGNPQSALLVRGLDICLDVNQDGRIRGAGFAASLFATTVCRLSLLVGVLNIWGVVHLLILLA